MCKGPEAVSGCMFQELTEDQCGWNSLEKGLQKGIMVERPMEMQWEQSHEGGMESGWILEVGLTHLAG